MEGFKANPKMKCDLPCFKEGGFVKRDKSKHSESTEMKKDVSQDKKIVKKAFKIHDEQSHDEKTDLSKLKKGGRCKKDVGTVKKYKKGGAVDAAEKGKPSGDKGKTKKVTAKPKKAKTPSKAATKAPEVPGMDMSPSGSMGEMSAPPAAGPMAAAPSPAMGMPPGGMQEFAKGGRPFFNEEPDDATAPVKRRPMKRPAPSKGVVSNAERQGIMNMFQGGPDGMSGLGDAGAAGVGSMRAPSAAMGNAGAQGMGVMSDLERQNLMKGLEAVGTYCSGGKAY
jgi:hypothetical protein